MRFTRNTQRVYEIPRVLPFLKVVARCGAQCSRGQQLHRAVRLRLVGAGCQAAAWLLLEKSSVSLVLHDSGKIKYFKLL